MIKIRNPLDALPSGVKELAEDVSPIHAGKPVTSFHFRVDFGVPGLFIKDVGFQSVSGLEMELSLEEVKVGGPDKLLMPNGYKFGDLVLSRGLLKSSYLLNWLEAQVLLQKKIPIPIIVTALDDYHLPIYCWVFINAYPVKVKTSGFDSQKSEVLVEELTFKYWFHKRIDLVKESSALKTALKAAEMAAKAAKNALK